MTEKGNHPRLTRAAAKRRAETPSTPVIPVQPPKSESPVVKKKRTVLGELTNVSNTRPVSAAADPKKKPNNNKPVKRKKQQSKPKPRAVAAAAVRNASSPIVAVDAGFNDPQICAHYAEDIQRYLRVLEAEPRRRASPDYMTAVQRDLTPGMRGILVDWLVEVADEYRLYPETLYLGISYVDRFLSRRSIPRQRLQLVGVTAMLIASKFEEISPPRVGDFVDITDNGYSKAEVVKMETDMLKALHFEMSNPTTVSFLRMFTRAGQENAESPSLQLESLACYFAELGLLDYGCLRFLPSLVAASAVFLARLTQKPEEHPWTFTLEQQSGYSASMLKDCVLAIHELQVLKRLRNLSAIREKYKQHKFKCVAALPPLPQIPLCYFDDTPAV